MHNNLISFFKFRNYLEFGYISFLVGVFFLSSALPIAGIFLLLSLVISFLNQEKKISKNNLDYLFFVAVILILLSTLNITLFNTPKELVNFNKSVIWLSLFNWIPILLSYFGFKVYLKNKNQKYLFIKIFIAGSLPVLLSCILQKFFSIYGPFKTLFGSIVWFNKSLIITDIDFMGGLTGLFSNPNYLGTWLAMLIPFLIAAFKEENKNSLKKIFLFFLNFISIYFAFLTNSRNAFIGIIITFFLMFNIKKNIKAYLLFGGFALFTIFLPVFLDTINQNFMEVTKYNLIKKFIIEEPFFSSPRFLIWKDTFLIILEKPFLGWGAGTYYEITASKAPDLSVFIFNASNHTHNIILELAYNFGIPTSLIITFTSVKLLFIAFKKVFISHQSSQNSPLNKAWIAGIIIFSFSHLSDITYYDGKISLLICILFAGLNSIVIEKEEIKI